MSDRLPDDLGEVDELVRLAREHIDNWQMFYRRVRLLQLMQLGILEQLLAAPSSYQAIVAASQDGRLSQLAAHVAACNEYMVSDEARKVSCPDSTLARYLDVGTIRSDDGLADRVQARQAAVFSHQIRSHHWHDVLVELEAIPSLPDRDLDAPSRLKLLHWQQQCEAAIDCYRISRDAEVSAALALIDRLHTHRRLIAVQVPVERPLPGDLVRDLGPRQRELVNLLWGGGSLPRVPFEEVLARMYPGQDPTKATASLESVIFRTRERFQLGKAGWDVGRDEGVHLVPPGEQGDARPTERSPQALG